MTFYKLVIFIMPEHLNTCSLVNDPNSGGSLNDNDHHKHCTWIGTNHSIIGVEPAILYGWYMGIEALY